jgi:hypothetical protein
MPFYLGVALLDAGLLDEARQVFEQLRATPWVARVDALERLLTA